MALKRVKNKKSEGKLVRMGNPYINNTPIAVLVSDRMRALIEYYGFQAVESAVKTGECKSYMLSIHLNNVYLYCGNEIYQDVCHFFFMDKKSDVVKNKKVRKSKVEIKPKLKTKTKKQPAFAG